jgi:hypothetical protein
VTTRSTTVRESLIAVSVAVVLVTVLTWPTLAGLTTFGRVDTGDGRFSIWNVGWIGHALLTDPRRLLDANIFHPHTGTLAYSELNLVAGVLGAPAYAVTGSAVAATNAAVFLGLVLAFLAMWTLVRRLTGSGAAGLGAAIAFTFCPFVQAHTPHIQLLMVFGIPLVLLAFHAFRDQPTLGRGAMLGAALAVVALSCAYYGIYAGLALGLVAVVLACGDRRYWTGLAVAATVTAILVGPIFVSYLAARRPVSASGAWNIEEVRGYSATLADYRSSPTYLHEHLPGGVLAPSKDSVFPGFLTLCLAALGTTSILRRGSAADRRIAMAYAALALVAAWASFGPDAGLYTVLMNTVPAIGMLRAPVRLGVVVTFALAVLAGFGIRRLADGRLWVPAAILPLMVVELASVPWPLVAVEPNVSAAYTLLADKPRGALVEFPFMYKSTEFHAHTRYMFNSTAHWQPLVNGYSDVIPPDFSEIATPINAFPDPESFELMRRLEVKYVIWHMDPDYGYDADSRQEILDRFPPYAKYLRQLTIDRDVWLYEIVGYP